MNDRHARRWNVSASPYLLLAIAALCWAGNFVLGRAIHAEIPPVALTFWRWLLAGLVLLPFTAHLVWNERAAVRTHKGALFVLALTGVGSFHICVYAALQSTTAINATLILTIVPVVIPVFAYVLDRERVGLLQALGIALSMVGVVVIVVRSDMEVLAALSFTPGDLWMLAAVPLWALYSVLLKRVTGRLSPMALLTTIIVIGIVLLLPLFLWELQQVGGIAPTTENLLSIGYVALFASIIAFIAWNRGVAVVGATKAGLFVHLMPVFAAGLAMVFLGETLRPYHLVGVVLIVAGLRLASARRTAEA